MMKYFFAIMFMCGPAFSSPCMDQIDRLLNLVETTRKHAAKLKEFLDLSYRSQTDSLQDLIDYDNGLKALSQKITQQKIRTEQICSGKQD